MKITNTQFGTGGRDNTKGNFYSYKAESLKDGVIRGRREKISFQEALERANAQRVEVEKVNKVSKRFN